MFDSLFRREKPYQDKNETNEEKPKEKAEKTEEAMQPEEQGPEIKEEAAPAPGESAETPLHGRQIYIEETGDKASHGFPWLRLILVFLGGIIVIGLIYGGLFIYQLGQAKEETITENFSGGAPALTGDGPHLPIPGEDTTQYDLINILLLGNGGAGHDGGGLTDVIQVLSINVSSKKALIVSIPRDLYVEVGNRGKHRINTMYVFGEESGKGMGGDQSKKIVGEVLGIPIHYYLKVDFRGFQDIVDALGGIDIYVDKNINDPVWGYKVSAGMHHFNGKQALDYVRSRKSTSDFDRSARQQKVLLALRDKAISLDLITNPQKITQTIEAVSNNLRTDITPEEIVKIFFIARDIPQAQVSNFVIDNGASGLLYSTISRGGAYILLPVGGNYNKIHEVIKSKLP